MTAPPAAVDTLDTLDQVLAGLGSVVVAFSGGTDSAFLAWSALSTLGAPNVLAVTAVSASLAQGERQHCQNLAASWGLPWIAVNTDELTNPEYLANAGDRCYWCKAELMDAIEPLVQARGATAVLGVNLDDLGEHRPGQGAAKERGARFPLVEAGLTKAMIREQSRAAGLSTWDRPAAACLASRIPYGTPVSIEVLSRVDRAEAVLHRCGLRQVRVRHYGDTARIEVELNELAQVMAERESIVSALKSVGYRYVTLDLEGFRSGNLNQAL